MNPVHTLTLQEYYAEKVIEIAMDNECSVEEVKEHYSMNSFKGKHFQYCFQAAQEGIVLTEKILDGLDPMGRYRIFHDLPDYLNLYYKTNGFPYINPEVKGK